MIKTLSTLSIFLFLIFFGTLAFSADRESFTPWDFSSSHSVGETSRDTSGAGSLAAGIMGLYSRTISRVDGDRCSMHPNCSVYSAQAFRKHGILIGALMTADRLIHEADESGLSPKIEIEGRVRNYDPVSNNDFWWNRESRSEFDK